MDHSYENEKDAVVTEAETQDPNVRAVSDEEKEAFLAEQEAAKGTSENVRPVSDEEKEAFLAEQNAGVDPAVDQTDDFRNPSN